MTIPNCFLKKLASHTFCRIVSKFSSDYTLHIIHYYVLIAVYPISTTSFGRKIPMNLPPIKCFLSSLHHLRFLKRFSHLKKIISPSQLSLHSIAYGRLTEMQGKSYSPLFIRQAPGRLKRCLSSSIFT